jgi:hypothetical protein
MKLSLSQMIFSLAWLGLFGVACNSAAPTPTPDLVATQVAVEKAAAATLTAEAAASQPAASTPTPAPAATPVPQSTGDALAQPTPTSTPGRAGPACTVVAASLNVRLGPGVAYEPPLTTVAQGTTLTPTGYSAVGYPGGQWVQVQTPDNQTGWVSADPQFVSCNVDPAALPPVSAPSPPTPTQTPTPIPAQPTPTSSPTPEQFVIFEPPGGGNDNIDGYVVFPGYTQGQLDFNNLVFRNRLVFRVVAFDKHKGQTDGAGIDNVRFEIRGDPGTVHERTERTAGYCVFGGGEPTCNVWVFSEHNYRWPEPHQDQLITNGDYNVQITINPKEGDSANWRFDFRIEGAREQGQPPSSNLTAQIVQTGPGTTSEVVGGALVFQVFASTDGVNDGAGIDRVEMEIVGPNGRVHQRTERTAGYCAFGGGEPNCNIWNFAEHGNQWPNGDPIEPGNYTLRATAHAKDDNSTTVERTIQIQ